MSTDYTEYHVKRSALGPNLIIRGNSDLQQLVQLHRELDTPVTPATIMHYVSKQDLDAVVTKYKLIVQQKNHDAFVASLAKENGLTPKKAEEMMAQMQKFYGGLT